jgi:hypothetical protein
MKKITYVTVMISAMILSTQSAIAQIYEVPPSSTTFSSVPWISDEAMESCVKLYNEGKWLGDKINRMQVDQYSQSSVSAYNNKVSKHSKLTNQFNQNCAGKQSKSAYEAAQKLNNQIKN